MKMESLRTLLGEIDVKTLLGWTLTSIATALMVCLSPYAGTVSVSGALCGSRLKWSVAEIRSACAKIIYSERIHCSPFSHGDAPFLGYRHSSSKPHEF